MWRNMLELEMQTIGWLHLRNADQTAVKSGVDEAQETFE